KKKISHYAYLTTTFLYKGTLLLLHHLFALWVRCSITWMIREGDLYYSIHVLDQHFRIIYRTCSSGNYGVLSLCFVCVDYRNQIGSWDMRGGGDIDILLMYQLSVFQSIYSSSA
ncbi:hypothetical protein ACJX0J_034694, partial [Zea mays]